MDPQSQNGGQPPQVPQATPPPPQNQGQNQQNPEPLPQQSPAQQLQQNAPNPLPSAQNPQPEQLPAPDAPLGQQDGLAAGPIPPPDVPPPKDMRQMLISGAILLAVVIVGGFIIFYMLRSSISGIRNVSKEPQTAQSKTATNDSPEQQQKRDTSREVGLKSIQVLLEGYWEKNGYYPTFSNINNLQFRKESLSNGTDRIYQDPLDEDVFMTKDYEHGQYQYEVIPDDCDNQQVMCVRYNLRTYLEVKKEALVYSNLN